MKLENINFRENTDDDKHIFNEIVISDMYRIKNLCRKYGNEISGTVIDCGAHIGVFSRWVHEFFPKCNFICFEPNKDNFALLSKNMDRVENKELYNFGVSCGDVPLRLYLPFDKSKTGQCSFKLYSYLNPDDYIDVQTMDFNNVMEMHNDIFIVKMDMEGYESVVLDKLNQGCLRKIKILILEEHPDCPINYKRIEDDGFSLSFRPYGQDRHSVYERK